MTRKIDGWPAQWLTETDDDALGSNRAEMAIQFIADFGVITKDSVSGRAGERLVLREWQKELVRHIYAQDQNGFKYKLALCGLPRKNGKSALASHLALFDTIFGPRGGETYSVAATRDQARIVFGEAKKIIAADEELSALAKLYRDAIEIPSTGSVYRVLSAEAGAAEGLNSTAVWIDELHAQPNRRMFDVMQLSMAARGNKAHMVAITTAGVKSDSLGHDSICYELYQYGKKVVRGEVHDPNFLFAWWESDGDHREPQTWREANPGFGDLNDEADFEAAMRRTPEPEFRTKRLNAFVSSAVSWLPAGAWDECRADVSITPDDEIILGFDGSFSGDCTVIVAATVPKDDEPVRVQMVKAWEKDLENDGDDWRVDIADVEQTIIDYCQQHPKVLEIACDPFRWQRSMQALEERGLPVVEYPSTTPRRMVAASAKFFDMTMDKQIQHNGDPTIARHLENAVVKTDNIGPRIVKESRNSPRKIDAAVATLIAVDRATVARIEQVVPQFFG